MIYLHEIDDFKPFYNDDTKTFSFNESIGIEMNKTLNLSKYTLYVKGDVFAPTVDTLITKNITATSLTVGALHAKDLYINKITAKSYIKANKITDSKTIKAPYIAAKEILTGDISAKGIKARRLTCNNILGFSDVFVDVLRVRFRAIAGKISESRQANFKI